MSDNLLRRERVTARLRENNRVARLIDNHSARFLADSDRVLYEVTEIEEFIRELRRAVLATEEEVRN